jgi:hypothetical protein
MPLSGSQPTSLECLFAGIFTANYNLVVPPWLYEIRSSADCHELSHLANVSARSNCSLNLSEYGRIQESNIWDRNPSFILTWVLWIAEPSPAADLAVMST